MNKKGFTLVEMLAIVVILAVIALITTPLILGIIDNSRKSAFASSVNSMKEAIENDIGNRDFSTAISYTYTNGSLYANIDSRQEAVDMKGSIADAKAGIGTVDSLGNVRVAVYSDKYCAYVGGSGSSSVTVISADGLTQDQCFAKIG